MPNQSSRTRGNQASGFNRRPDRFNPKMLARSVIAIPLLEQIQAELETTAAFRERYPELASTRNAAVILDASSEEETAGAYGRLQELLAGAEEYIASKTRTPSKENAAPPKKRGRKSAGAVAEEELAAAEKNLIDEPRLIEDRVVCLARLEGRVMRVMLAMDHDAVQSVIADLWPTRHDVIIDINLGFKPQDRLLSVLRSETGVTVDPDVRAVAKRLIERYVEWLKPRLEVNDPDQQVDRRTSATSEQYVFAQLEGKVIRELVDLDARVATAFAHLEVSEGLRKGEKWAQELAPERATDPPNDFFGVLEAGTLWLDSLLAAGFVLSQTLRIDQSKLDLSRLRTIHRVWPDFAIHTCQSLSSLPTVKADAAQRAFAASGENITWAVIDTGIDADHPHFRLHKNVDRASPYHKDFTRWLDAPAGELAAPAPAESDDGGASALIDKRGHGTHVAGIIAGEQQRTSATLAAEMNAVVQELGSDMKGAYKEVALDSISGVAPKCRLVSLKVLDDFGAGKTKHVIAAIRHIQRINGHGRELHIHGVNISAGYPFEAKWFACGHSPICVEINRLVKSGVVVVVAAGNTGYGTLDIGNKAIDTSLDLTINDPGNAAEAITVGSTHRDQPHRYGVSFFSSKGPTGDGRLKPDLLAPGEKIISCSVAKSKLNETDGDSRPCGYLETSGTSMAAPHVSGAVAAFLSIRGEFVGQPERVKQIFMSTATDLGRDRYFQGAGLVDLMRAIQSI